MRIQVFVIHQQQVILLQATRAEVFWIIDLTGRITAFPVKLVVTHWETN